MRRPVLGWEGFYEVSESGEVYSLTRSIRRSDGTMQTWAGQRLTAYTNSRGYLAVRLSRPGCRKVARVHRLVAEAFLPNPSALPEVNHLDGDRTNPSVNNLEWCSASQNRWHAFHVLKSVVMPRNGKLSADLAEAIRQEHIPGVYGCKRLAKKYGVVPSSIRAILNNKSYVKEEA